MDQTTVILIIACIGAFFMAFNNGANDVANAFAPAVGSKAITVKQALVIAAILNLVGAILLGGEVAKTMLEAVISKDLTINPEQYILGMIASLLASGCFVLLSTLTGMPVSSTHAIVGSLAGVGIIVDGFSAVNWGAFGVIGLFWIISPLIAGAFSWATIRFIRTQIYKKSKKGKLIKRFINKIPILIALVGSLTIFGLLKRSILADTLRLDNYISWSFILGSFILIYFITRLILSKWLSHSDKNEEEAEGAFKKLQIGTSCLVAFAHGSNDVSNSISPVIAIWLVIQTGQIPMPHESFPIPIWILILGAVGMSAGIGLLGHKVMATLGNKITLMTNTKGFSVDFATATTVVLATILGMPVSSTHAATGSVVGVALDKGRSGINLSILVKIFSAWIITVPIAATLTILIYLLLDFIF